MKMEWQPIETAPKGYAVVLLADAKGNVGQGHRQNITRPNGWCWQATMYECEPTHWMPLPTPPTMETSL